MKYNKELLDTHIEQIDSMCDYIKRKVVWGKSRRSTRPF